MHGGALHRARFARQVPGFQPLIILLELKAVVAGPHKPSGCQLFMFMAAWKRHLREQHMGTTASDAPQLYTLRCSEPGATAGCRGNSADFLQVLWR